MWQIPVTTSFPAHSGLSSHFSVEIPKLSCGHRDQPKAWERLHVHCATCEWSQLMLLITFLDNLVQTHHLCYRKDPSLIHEFTYRNLLTEKGHWWQNLGKQSVTFKCHNSYGKTKIKKYSTPFSPVGIAHRTAISTRRLSLDKQHWSWKRIFSI